MDKSVAKGVVNKIKGATEKTVDFAMSAFKYAPIFPIKIDRNADGDFDDKGEKMANFQDIMHLGSVPKDWMALKDQESKDEVRKHVKEHLGIDLT